MALDPGRFPLPIALALALLAGGCAPVDAAPVDAQRIGDAWVFTYGETPRSSMDALLSGEPAVVGDCLEVGGGVVIWYPDQLSDVRRVVDAVQAGETVRVELGGGGASLEEGSTVDDFPPQVLEHCSPTTIWYAADGPLTIEEDG